MKGRIPVVRLRATLAVTLLVVIASWTVDFAALAGVVQTAIGADEPRRFETRQLNEHFWGEGATTADITRDGRQDIVSGPFWYEGPGFTRRHEYMPATQFFERKREDGTVETIPGFEGALGTRNVYSENFLAFTYDFNRDSWPDILIVGFPGRATTWYENPRGAGQGRHWKPHVVLARTENESPTFIDVTGDGRPELVCNSGGFFGYAEQTATDPTAPWTFRPISPQGKWGPYTHGLGVGDLNGDGRPDIIEATGWWEQPASLTGQPVWRRHAAEFGPGAQFLVYDVNDDGRADVIGSLNAHEWGLAWHEQQRTDGQITFRRHLIMGSAPGEMPHRVAFSQPHALALADIDRDGLRDIVTGKRFWAHGRDGDPEPNAPAVVYWFRLVRKGPHVEWVPHLIDDNSGVGTQVWVADATGDGLADVVVGNKKGTFLHVQQRIETPRPTAAPAANLTPAPARAPFVGLRPADAVKAMALPPGFRAEVFAGEPDVRQPVAFAIDDRGRVWVAEAYAYPVRQPEGQGKDRILVFEDTNGDGSFDRRTIFADDLNLVSAIEIGFGGVWVGAAPYLMFIPMTDGDEPKPSGPPRILLDGWGHEDTHETLNSMIWGPDGWLYGAHGVFTNSAVGAPGTPAAERTRLNGGIWRYHPTKHRFEVFAEGLSNPWGLDFNDRGHAVAVACVIPHLWHIVQGGRYQRQAGQHFNPNYYDDLRTIGDHLHYVGASPWAGNTQSGAVGGGHAHAGLMVYQGGSWPEPYRGQTFMNNIHGARINVDAIEPAGSGYIGRHGADFIDFNDRASQIINLQYDQDGSVYMIDWYDQEQCHINDPNVPDRGNGRIYKVVYGDTPTTRVDVQALSDDVLIRAQFSRREWHVRHARRVLQERAAAGRLAAGTIPALRGLAGLDRSATTPAVPVGPDSYANDSLSARLRLLWALHAVKGLSESHLLTLMRDREEHVRAWAVQLASEDGDVPPPVAAALADLARADASPTVRLVLASAAQRVRPDARWAIVQGLHAHQVAGDHNLPMMNWYALEGLVESDPARALAVATASMAPRTLEFTARRVAAMGTADAIDVLVTALSQTADDARRLSMLTGINAALVGQRHVRLPGGWDAVERTLEASADPRVRTAAQSLALTFASPRALASARRTLGDATMPAESRSRALDVLLNVRDEALPPLLLDALDDRKLRPAAIRGLAAFDDPRTSTRLLDLYPSLAAAEKRDALLTLSSRAASARALVDALAAGRVPVRDVSADIARQVRSLDQPEITATLEKVWGVARRDDTSARAAMARYVALVENADLPRPSPSRGRRVFVDSCGACHTLFGEGGEIGPDITGSNRANLDYLLHNILSPNAEIPNAYRTATVELHDGRVIAGIANVQNPGVVTVQTTNELVSVPRSDVKSLVQSDVSMMPEGLLNPLSDEEVRSLIAYLRGARQVPLPPPGP
ncbi:MAG: VCBS repeat-containing protein [Acidobacteria bacterium]|nr:VCBS repeat-containing protein [Acidobacteriota bacterium]